MAGEQRMCPDCSAALQEIRLIDKAHYGTHNALEYAAIESKASIWTGAYPIEGRVAAFMCPACGRIALYGAAKAVR